MLEETVEVSIAPSVKPKLKGRLNTVLSDQNIIYICVTSIFLPYFFTACIIVAAALYLLINPDTRKRIFVHKGSLMLLPFFALSLIVPIVYKNWLGAAGGLALMLIMILALFFRSAMKKRIYEHVLSLICLYSIPMTVIAIIERVMFQPGTPSYFYRSQAIFFNANYFATIMGTVIVICAYKVITGKGQSIIFYGIAAFSGISIYLCGSLFVWVEIFVGVASFLLLKKRHKMLSMLLFLAGIFCILIYLDVGIVPRISESFITTGRRVEIWSTALGAIKDAPFFGKGLMTYFHVFKDYPGSFPSQHSHNMYIDPILNFGVVGTAFFLVYFINYYKTAFYSRKVDSQGSGKDITSLILSITIAVLVHGMIDITVLWVQTGLLMVILMGGLGVSERSHRLKR